MTTQKTTLYQYLLFSTVVLCALVLFWNLGGLQLLSLNEGRRALVIKEMFASGNWLLPTQNGALYLTKPPLLYWFSLLFSQLVGEVNEWTLRLPSAIAAASVLWMVYQFSKKNFDHWVALFAVQILIGNAAFAMLARRVEIEMLLTALCVGALFSALEYCHEGNQKNKHFWIYLSYFLLGLAILTKGPVAMLFVTLPLLLTWLWTRDTRFKAVLTNKIGWLIFLMVGLSWYFAVTLQLGTDIWVSITQKDMINKMQAEDLAKPLLSYIGWIAVDFLLLISMFIYKPKSLWADNKHKKNFVAIVLAVVAVIIVFSAFSNKHAKYLLPMYPLLAVILAVQLNRIFCTFGQATKKLILSLGLLIPMTYVVFYSVAEAKLFDYRVSAFSTFTAWSESVPVNQLYVFDEIDSRLIYYSRKPMMIMPEKTFDQLASANQFVTAEQKSLVIITDHNEEKIAKLAGCKLQTFKPYLKKNKSLTVFGFGAVCQ
jgi:4-amino-4-deoxy-L-arabinose transferase-like glycosyltransferase